MTREFAVISFLAFIAGTAFGQSTNAKPRFEAADVHPSAPTRSFKVYITGGVLRGERYDLRKATMLDLVARAWDVDPETVAGGRVGSIWIDSTSRPKRRRERRAKCFG